MLIIYATFALASALACIFSFWVGRCSRKLPIIDDNLPWTMNWVQFPRCSADCEAGKVHPSVLPDSPESRLAEAGNY
jgi:hypothetical protein